MKNSCRTGLDALVIGGHFAIGHQDTMHHVDDFRLHCDGVPMSIPHLREYFNNGRRFNDAQRRRVREQYRPYRQLYYSALHIYDFLRQEGFTAALLNCHYAEDSRRLELYKEKPRFVVISTTYMNMEAVRSVVADIRRHLPESVIVVGGNYVRHSYLIWRRKDEPYYNDPDVLDRYFFTARNPVADVDAFIVDAHGEKTLVNLMHRRLKGGSMQDLPNIAYWDNGQLTVNREEPEAFSMDDYPISWKTLPRELLSTVVPFSMTCGCPFSCGFCNFAKVGMSEKSMDVVFQELRDIATLGVVQKVWFTDDNFLLSPSKVEQFCRRYMDEGLPFSWMSFIRASSITPRTAELLKQSRAELLVLGLESGSPGMLRAMNKKDTVSHYTQAMSLLLAHDIDTELAFVFGYPGETDRTVTETIEFINSLPYSDNQISYLYLFKFHLVPLSPVFETDVRLRWKLEGNFLRYRHETMDSDYVDTVMRRVAVETSGPVFNYLDGVVNLEKKDIVRLMRTRHTLARAILAGKDAASLAPLWDTLEMQVASRFSPGGAPEMDTR